MKLSTGVPRLDEMLGGGAPERASVLAYGPPFIGKETLARLFLLAGLREGEPAIVVLTNASAADFAADLAAIDPRYPEWEKAGLVHVVDTYSKAIGADDPRPNTEYLDGPMNLNAIALAVSTAEKRLVEHARHRLVFESLSTLVAYTNAQTTFRFLQVLVGKTRRAGATSLLLLEQGMHAEADVQTFKHLVDGFVELRPADGHYALAVEGVGVTENRGWIEYRFSERDFDVTGSLAGGRIR